VTAGATLASTPLEAALQASAAGQARRRLRTHRAVVAAGRGAVLAAVLGGWALASGRLVDREFLSAPGPVFAALVELVASGRLWPHLAQTLGEVLAGYTAGALLGLALAALVAVAEPVLAVVRPFLVAFYSIPKIALAPLIVMWFGLGALPKVLLAAAFVFFVVFMNVVTGVAAVSPSLVDVLRVMGARRSAVLRTVTLPSVVPYLVTGLRLAVPEALIGAVVGEFISANQGLGYLVTSAASQFNTAATLAAIVALLAIVAVLDGGLTLCERRLLRWRPSGDALVTRER
jgi:NitT/TauT family transport system permease protein